GPPVELRHRIVAQFAGYRDAMEITGDPVAVGAQPIQLGPPLKGESWKAHGGPSPDSYHRNALAAFEGRFTGAQRFAIACAKAARKGEPFTGNGRATQITTLGEQR